MQDAVLGLPRGAREPRWTPPGRPGATSQGSPACDLLRAVGRSSGRTNPGQLSPPHCPEMLQPACVESGSLKWGPEQVRQAAECVSHPEKHGHRKPRFSCVLGLVTFEREK